MKKSFYARLDHMMDISARSLKVKRTVITKLLDESACILTPSGIWEPSSNHFSTIGLIGMNEAGLNAKLAARRYDASARRRNLPRRC